MRRLAAAAILTAVLAACGSDDDDEGAGTVATVTETSGEPTTSESTPPSSTSGPLVPATEQPVLQSTTSSSSPVPSPSGPPSPDEAAAIADLAAREGVEPAAITTVSVEEVTWRDSALGCPEPGMNYLQVLTDGVRIVLELDGVRYEYHGGGSRPVFYCANPEPPLGD
jgi:hypothetical protein